MRRTSVDALASTRKALTALREASVLLSDAETKLRGSASTTDSVSVSGSEFPGFVSLTEDIGASSHVILCRWPMGSKFGLSVQLQFRCLGGFPASKVF